MKKKELLDKLTALAPALATNELVPQLTQFWFDRETIKAYNDRIGISTKFKCGFSGGLPGATLLGLVRNSRDGKDDEIQLADRDNEVEIKSTGETALLALMLQGRPSYDDKASGKTIGVTGDEIIPALKRCLLTVTDDTSVPDQLGVTFVPDGDNIAMYSTNGNLITEAVIRGRLDTRAILSTEFCQQIVALAPADSAKLKLEIKNSHALLVLPEFTLYGRLIEAEKPLPFMNMFETHFPTKLNKTLFPVPTAFKTAIERSLVMAASSDGDAKIRLIVKGDELKMITRSTVGKSVLGTITDTVEISGSKHPNVEAEVSPKSLKTIIGVYDKMAITEKAVILCLEEERDGSVLAATTNT